MEEDKSKAYNGNLEKVIGTPGKVKILCYLANNYPHDWPNSQIMRQTGLSKRATRMNLDDLTEIGVVTYRELGNRRFYMIASKELYTILLNFENNIRKTMQSGQPIIEAS